MTRRLDELNEKAARCDELQDELDVARSQSEKAARIERENEQLKRRLSEVATFPGQLQVY